MSDELITSKVLEETTSYYFGCPKCGLSNMVTILPANNLRKCDWCGEKFDITDKSVVSHGYSGFSGTGFTGYGLMGFSGFSGFQGRSGFSDNAQTWSGAVFSGNDSRQERRERRREKRRARRMSYVPSFMRRFLE